VRSLYQDGSEELHPGCLLEFVGMVCKFGARVGLARLRERPPEQALDREAEDKRPHRRCSGSELKV
jgi:hypothetical protein